MANPSMDFACVRARADFATLLAHYGIAVPRREGQITVRCPFHEDRRPSLSVSLERKLFHCFACQAKGDIIDFVARIEDASLLEAARIIIRHCGILLEGQPHYPLPNPAKDCHDKAREHPCSEEDRPYDDDTDPYCPLPLDPTHPYLFERGLTPAQIEAFGLGYCGRGRLRGRVCIPLHSRDGGRILAYSGRWANDIVPDGTPRYLMPRGFKKSAMLYNYHRVVGARHLVIVEGYWSVFRLHALDIPAVALMGTSLSDRQSDLLHQSGARRLTLLLDGDQAGRTATAAALPRLASRFFVRTPTLPADQSPDTVPEPALLATVQS